MYALDNPKLKKLVHAVQSALTNDLRRPQYRGAENALAGHCYISSEALFHLLGGGKSGWVPQNVKHEGEPHWYLKHKISGAILDPTASQFKTPVPYHEGKGKGFLTKQPSKRAQVVLDRLKNEGLDLPVQKAELSKGMFAQAAFRHKATGQVIPTGSFHDLEQVPDFNTHTHDEGFVDHQGKFFTREEAKVALNRPHTVVSEHLFEDNPRRKWRMSALPEEFGSGLNKNQSISDWLMQKSHSKSKCMFCSSPPVYECKWAEGMARAWFCVKHWASWADEHEQDIDFVRELTAGEVGEKYGEAPGHALKKSDANPSIPEMPSDHCQAFVVAQGIVRQCKKPVKASGLCYLHLAKIGHFFEGENDKQKKVEVSSIAVFNSEGYLLMGVRNDSQKWTLPGGKAEQGESAKSCAHRELWEEAGLKIKSLEHLGSGWGGKNGDVKISVFRGKSDDKPTSENDPDKEVDEWEWIDVREGLPEEVKGKLHNGKHDITLQILGLLEGETHVELSKSWKHAFVGAMTAASLSGTPAMAQDGVTDDHHQEWRPDGLAEELKPIAHLESSFGKKLKHLPHSKGEYHTAFGAVGLKGITAHEEYNRTKYLQQIYPDLHDQTKFMEEFKSNPAFYNAVATAHWNRLKKLFGGDVNKTAYAWRWGQGRAAQADDEAISVSPYVQGYNKIYSTIRTDQVVLVNPLEKKAKEWLSKSMDRPSTQRLILYDLAEDPFGHLEPKARHTDDGTFYEATEMADVADKLKRLGYHGYHDPEGGGPVVFPEFQHLASMAIH